MGIERRFTKKDVSPVSGLKWMAIPVDTIDGDDWQGSAQFEAPRSWSRSSVDVMVNHIACRSGVAAFLRKSPQDGVPEFLWPSVPDEDALRLLPEPHRYRAETSAFEVFHRLAGSWAYAGWRGGYFQTEDDVQAYYDEILHCLAYQIVTPDLALWAKAGLDWAYGIIGEDPDAGVLATFVAPTPPLRAEVSQAGIGLLDRLRLQDRLAEFQTFLSPKESAATRRHAQPVVVPIDHPEVDEFIHWKVEEEQKLAALVVGAHSHEKHTKLILEAVRTTVGDGQPRDDDLGRHPKVMAALSAARQAKIPENHIQRLLQYCAQGHDKFEFPAFDTDWDGAGYRLIGGRYSHSVLDVSDAFMAAQCDDVAWNAGPKTFSAGKLWRDIGAATWACGEPELIFGDTCRSWQPITGQDLIDDDANLLNATINLAYFARSEVFDTAGLIDTVRLWVLTLDIAHGLALERGHIKAQIKSRPIGLRYSNLGHVLLGRALGYDSAPARVFAGAISALIAGVAYACSAELAASLGPFASYHQNRASMHKVINNRYHAAWGGAGTVDAPLSETLKKSLYSTDMIEVVAEYEGLNQPPVALRPCDRSGLDLTSLHELYGNDDLETSLIIFARTAWAEAKALGEQYGYRNAQVTTATRTELNDILLGCQTIGFDPETALVKFVKQDDEFYTKQLNPALSQALRILGYNVHQVDEVILYVLGRRSLALSPWINHQVLFRFGFGLDEINKLEVAAQNALHLRHVFTPWTIGLTFCRTVLGIDNEVLSDPSFDLLSYLGFPPEQVAQANDYVCGVLHLEGAPHINPEHLAIFDCVSPLGCGTRHLRPAAHLLMRGAIQSFVCCPIDQTISLPAQTQIDTVIECYDLAYQLGLLRCKLYREGAKLSQPIPDASSEGEVNTPTAPSETLAAVESVQVLGAAPVLASSQTLPRRRNGFSQKSHICGRDISLRTGEYSDGRLGEVRLDVSQETIGYRALLKHFALAVSVGLQHGVAIETFAQAAQSLAADPTTGSGQGHITQAMIEHVFEELLGAYQLQKVAS